MYGRRKDISAAQKLRYISLAIEDVARMRVGNKGYVPKTSLIGYACQYTSQPKLKPEDFEPLLDMTLREIINTEIDFPLTKKEQESWHEILRKLKKIKE